MLLSLTSLVLQNVSADSVWTNKTVYQVGEIVIIYFDASSYASNAYLSVEGPYGLAFSTSLAGFSPGTHSWRFSVAEQRDIGRWKVTFTPGCEPALLCSPVFSFATFQVVEPETTSTTSTTKSTTKTTTTRSSAATFTVTTRPSTTTLGTFSPLESSQPSILQSPLLMPALIATWFVTVLAYTAHRVNLVYRRGPSPRTLSRTTKGGSPRIVSVEPGTTHPQPYITPGFDQTDPIIGPGQTTSIGPGEQLGPSQPRPIIPAIPLPFPRRSKICMHCGRKIPQKSPYCLVCGMKQD